MKKSKRKQTLPQNQLPINSTEGSESSARLPWDYSPPTLAVEGAERYQMIYSTDVNLTIQLRVTEFTRKQATLLTGQALFKVATEGMGILDWMTLEFLYNYLLGSKLEPLNLKDSKELELALLLKVVLLSGTWMGLEIKGQLPEDIRNMIHSSQWVPSNRTYQSREQHFQLSKFLFVRIVSVDALTERSKGTVRYSSYCKGYGESSHMGRRQKTRPSAELDGEPVKLEEETKVPLSRISQILDLVLLETRYKTLQRK